PVLMKKRKIDWLNHSLEFLVVLIGILIAFQLNKYGDSKNQDRLIDNHLAQIGLECEENREKISQAIAQINSQISTCDDLLGEISSTKNPLTIRNYAIQLLDLRGVDINETAFEVLVQSGDIRFLKDYEAKSKIIALYGGFEKIERIDQSNQNLYDQHYYPYLKTNFDLVNWQQVSTPTQAEAKAYAALEFANTVSTYRYLLAAKQRIYQQQLEVLDAYLQATSD
ncbi:MAG: hypothetical protein AAFQ98_25670, partial [Bacteroidota bacterium]